jgi:pyrophosphate--fructose-6-phosphate 1-phosphotransferase
LTSLKEIMDQNDCCNIFLSEGAGVESIVAEMEARGEEIPRDAFGHIKLDKINPGAWFAKQFAEKIGAEKVLVQKSGYYSRAAAANQQDRDLIKACCEKGVESALAGVTGCIGHDEDQGDELRAIEFPRIAGGKPFDKSVDWFQALLADIGQPDLAVSAAGDATSGESPHVSGDTADGTPRA